MSDDFATKADLTEAITASETRLLERMDGLAERMDGLAERMDAFVVRMDERMDAFGVRMDERMDALAERVETRLLTEFHKYALASEPRITVTEVATHTLSDRMAAIETRVRELERKSQRDNIM